MTVRLTISGLPLKRMLTATNNIKISSMGATDLLTLNCLKQPTVSILAKHNIKWITRYSLLVGIRHIAS